MAEIDRRHFIQFAGATLLTPLASGTEAITVIKTGILGTQHSHTTGKLKAMRDSPDYDVVGVCEPDAAARERAQKAPGFSGLKWVAEEELLSNPSINLIVVECRPWEAIAWGKKVIAAGKHLHLEKPPGNKWEPFKELVEEARRKKLLLQTGYMWRWHEGINLGIDAAKNGWLGHVHLVRGTIHSDRTAEGRAIEAKYRGGSMFELGGHLIDRVVEVLGRPKKVNNWLRHDTGINDELADNTLVVLEYDNALAVLSSSARMYGSGEHRSFEVIGTDGSVIVHPEGSRPRVRVTMRKPQGPYKAGWQDVEIPAQPRYVGDFKDLGRALKTGQPLKHSYDHELTLHETLLRASGELS